MTEPVTQGSPYSHTYRIDTHHHILPPTYLAEERERILRTVRVERSFLEWSPERSLEESLGSSLARVSLLDRRLGRVVVESNWATLSEKVGALDPDTALLRTMPGLGLPQPGFLLQESMNSAQE